MNFFSNFGKREGLVYTIVILWITMGLIGAYKEASFSDLAIYFGSLTAYAVTYIWAETKRPSEKTRMITKGPNSRREVMIYAVVIIWAIAGAFAMIYKADLNQLTIYFVSLTGFVTTWIAGEVYKPQDDINKNNKD